jgi:hypothetical protein
MRIDLLKSKVPWIPHGYTPMTSTVSAEGIPLGGGRIFASLSTQGY